MSNHPLINFLASHNENGRGSPHEMNRPSSNSDGNSSLLRAPASSSLDGSSSLLRSSLFSSSNSDGSLSMHRNPLPSPTSPNSDGTPSILRVNPLLSSQNSDAPPPMVRINPLLAQAFSAHQGDKGSLPMPHNIFFHGSDLRPPRNRKPNYSENEKQIFFALISPHVDVLDAKSQERQIMTMKTEIWKEITLKYNEIITKLSGSYVCRDSEELKTFWKNVRRSTRRRSAVEVPDLSERMGMENQPSPGKLEGSSSYLTCSPIISTMSGLHEDMMSGAGPSSSCHESGDNESMHQDYDQDDIDVKAEPVFNVEPEICEDESQNNTQSSCDRRSSQSSPAPAGMAGPYLLKKETHCTTILDQLLRDDTFCDVTLTAEGQSMRAHKIVLCLASAYFRQVLSKEANVQNVIVFRDIKFAELKNLINFIYTGEATVDAAELESFMKTAEMLEVTSLCDGQRKIPRNLIPKPRDTESERTRTNIPTKRALNTSSTPPPAKSRKVDDSFKTTKSISQASTSGGTTHQSSVLHHTPQLFLHSPPVIKSEPATEDENPPEEEFRTFESLTQSPGYQESDTTQSTDNDTGPSVNKVPVGGCPFCPLDQILTGVTLTQHLSTTHPDKTVFPCQACLRVFLKKGAYDAHIENCNR